MENPYSAPRAEILAPTGSQAPLTWKQILFSFEGRIPRRTWWGFSILMNIIHAVIERVGPLAFGESAAPYLLIGAPVLTLWPSLAINAKRWHDRNKSGWWSAIIFLPLFAMFWWPGFLVVFVIGALWAFVECGCLRGNFGPNNYGEDPT